MQTLPTKTKNALAAPTRYVKAKVELYNGSTLAKTFLPEDALKSINIERIGEESKFFGFGIVQKLSLHLVDMQRNINVSTANSLKVYIGVQQEENASSSAAIAGRAVAGETIVGNNGEQVSITYFGFPNFYVTEVNRDENTNELSITAYDLIYKNNKKTVNELSLTAPYTLRQFAAACATLFGTTVDGINGTEWNTSYTEGANFDGSEAVRDALTMLAEATQSIYFMGADNVLHFKRLGGNSVLSITKNDYITLKSGHNRRLQTICSCTELGDNVSEGTTQTGTTQYIRENAFWNMRDDVATLVHNAVTAVGDMTINQFECDWRGNPALECGDKITLTTKDNNTIISYVLNDTISYDGSLKEKTSWNYQDNDSETESNPTSIGDALKNTFAKVDKVDRRITMMASETEDNFAQVEINTGAIISSVESISGKLDNMDTMSDDISKLKERAELMMDSGSVNIAIQDYINNNGVKEVVTEKGFSFDNKGLTISQSDSDISTTIDEDGMEVTKDGTTVLVADSKGVDAKDLHATTYLIIGKNIRFEDWGNTTACFWIGG